jgi:hypothetical protein
MAGWTLHLPMAESETRIIYEFKHQIGDFEAYKLLENGTEERYVEALAKAAVDHGESAA